MKNAVSRGVQSTKQLAKGMRIPPAGIWNRVRAMAGRTAGSLTKGGIKGVLSRGLKGGIGGMVASVAGGFAIDSAVENGWISGRMGDALQGALSWGGTAAMTGNPFIMGGAAIVGGLKGYFSGPNANATSSTPAIAAGNMAQNAATDALTKIYDRITEMVELIRSSKAGATFGTLFGGNESFDLRHSGIGGWSTRSTAALSPSSRMLIEDAIGSYQLPMGAKKTVTSTFRNEAANAASNGEKNSLHMTGDALDMQIHDVRGNLDVAAMRRMAANINKQYGSMGLQAMVHDAGSGMHLHVENEGRGNGRDTGWSREILMEIAKASRETAQASASMAQNANIFSQKTIRYQP